MNHFSLNSDTLCYTPSTMEPPHLKSLPFFYPPSLSLSSSSNFHHLDSDSTTTDNNHNTNTPTTTSTITNAASNAIDRSETSSVHREYMFEKPLTPSDVGKLNRLVIPKQHAEKYFPLAAPAADSSSSSPVSGGLLLGFEDESGKCWKFRYSYWNSSQSYVLTKGWSRYVKEKKLVAGDVVLFERHRFEPDRFFIGWRRRGTAPAQYNSHNYGSVQSHGYNGALHQHQISSFQSYRPDCLHAGTVEVRLEGRKTGNSKRVRLFGVNLEYQIEEEEAEEDPQTSDGSSLSSQGQGQTQTQTQPGSGFGVGPPAYNYFDYVGYAPNHNYTSHMDMNFPEDVKQMRNGLR